MHNCMHAPYTVNGYNRSIMFFIAAEGLEGVGDGEEGKDGTATVGTDIKEETSKGMIRFRIYKTSPRTPLRTTDANLIIAQWFGMG